MNNPKIQRHIKSFILSYITTFFVAYLLVVNEMTMFDLDLIANVAKASLLVVIRNIVKLYTDKFYTEKNEH